jgi:lipopolysaccharide cholinephosphotransferase
MDIGLLRRDYQKFISIAKEELDPSYFLQTFNSDTHYGHGYAKLRIRNTVFLEDYTKDSKQNNGVFLDVFPFDNIPDNKLLKKIQYLQFKCYKWSLLGKTDGYSFVQRKRRLFAKTMGIMIPWNRKKTYTKMCNICTKYIGCNTVYAANLFGAYYDNDYYRCDDLKDVIEIEFEGYLFKAPRNYHRFLSHIYGDYMKLPPENKRRCHTQTKPNLGSYYIRNKQYQKEKK